MQTRVGRGENGRENPRSGDEPPAQLFGGGVACPDSALLRAWRLSYCATRPFGCLLARSRSVRATQCMVIGGLRHLASVVPCSGQ